MRSRLCWGVVAAIAVLGFAAAAQAQQGIAEVRGRVVDAQNAVLPGVVVTVTNQDTGIFREVTSNADGTYFVTGIVPGTYEVSAVLQGFKKSVRRDVLLSIGRSTTVDLLLEVGGLEETVTVTTQAPLVDVTSSEIGGNVTREDITDTPSVNRNYIEFLGLLPGIVPNSSTISFGADTINVNGQNSASNNYMVDGGNNNDDYLGQGFGSQARTALESIQEFQVLTNQYDAEFGRTTGGVVNAITKQGSNQYRGSLFNFWTDSSVTAEDYFVRTQNLPKPPTTKKQWGGTLGGPIVKDRAHYFFSLERIIINEGRSSVFTTRPDRNFAISQDTDVWNYMGRIDHQLTSNQTYSVRWLYESSPQNPQFNPGSTIDSLREETDIDQTVVGQVSSVFGNTKFNTLRVSWTMEDINRSNPQYFDNGQRQWELAATQSYLSFIDVQNPAGEQRINNAWHVEDTFSWFLPGHRGDHDLKVGAQFQVINHRFNDQTNMNGTFTFRSDAAFTSSAPATYPERLSIRVPGPDDSFMQSKTIIGFVQDKWRVNPRLTFSIGLRYDLEIIPIRGVAVAPLMDSPSDYPVDKNNIAPRLGVVYDVSGNGSAVFRGGYGMFYDRTSLTVVDEINRQGVYSSSFTALFPAAQPDPGPSQGRLPTDPMLINGPVVNRTLLNQLVPSGTLNRNTGTVWLDHPDRKVPYNHNVTFGYERQIAQSISVSADYIHSVGKDQFVNAEINPGVRVNTSRTGQLPRTDLLGVAQELGVTPFAGSMQIRQNVGEMRYDGLNLALEKRYSHNFSGRVSYAIGKARGNVNGGLGDTPNFQFLDDLNLDMNEGPTSSDRTHNFVVSFRSMVPRTGGLTVSGVFRALSGTPLTIHDTNFDLDRNGILFDPLPAGSYSGTGPDAINVDNKGGRNGARGPGFSQLDMRIGYRLRVLNNRTLDVFGEIFNVMNRVNFDNPSGDLRSGAQFLVPTTLRGGGFPRQFQLGARFGF
jgi:carboxypeptidase family protein/TonB-dependent receptor-like protein